MIMLKACNAAGTTRFRSSRSRVTTNLLALIVVANLLAAAPNVTHAGGFSVAPVRLFFSERDRAVALKLSNESDEEVLLHTDLQTWTQDAEGKDQLEPSDDLVISPPVLRIKPRSEQVVRLIMAVPRDLSRQMTYRLFLR